MSKAKRTKRLVKGRDWHGYAFKSNRTGKLKSWVYQYEPVCNVEGHTLVRVKLVEVENVTVVEEEE